MVKVDSFELKKDNVLVFSLKGTDIKFANHLRRTLVSEIPIVAMERIIFYENSSTFFDEYLSHRFGLIPLKMPSKYKSDAEYMFILDEKGPKKVYSGDIKPTDHSIKPAIEDIPIITLLEDQTLRVEAKAVVDTGKRHARFQPCCATYSSDDKSGDITFRIESFYQMDPKTLLSKALDVMDKNLAHLEKQVSKIK